MGLPIIRPGVDGKANAGSGADRHWVY